MRSIQRAHRKLAWDFIDEQLTSVAGLAFVARAAHRLGLLKLLDGFEPCKRRDRGASDQENLMGLLGCLTSGSGKLCDLDDLRDDAVARRALGLVRASGSRRMGEWLVKIKPQHVASLQAMSRTVATRIAPTVIAAAVDTCGYVPLFWDGTAIQVYGKHIKEAAQTYGETDQYWVRGVFLGPLQIGGHLAPGHEDAVGDWQMQLTEDIDPLIPEGTPVWALMNNAYYRGELVLALDARGWDWSISVTHQKNKRAALRHLPSTAIWTPLNDH